MNTFFKLSIQLDKLLSQYILKYEEKTHKIININHVSMGKIEFRAHCADSSAGYQANSIVQLWTHFVKNVFNIVHVHLNDTSDQVPLEVEYLHEMNYNLKEIKFGNDLAG